MYTPINIQGFNNGEESAFKEIFFLFRPLSMSLATKYVRHEDAEEIVEDTFFKLFTAVKEGEKFSNIRHIKDWLCICVKNASINRYHQHAVRMRHLDNIELQETTDMPFKEENWLLPLLNTLPPQCQSIMKLLFIEEKESHDVATLLNITRQTVLNQKARGIRLLKKRLQLLGVVK